MERKEIDVRTDVPLASYTTLGIGGPAEFFYDATTHADLTAALSFARAKQLPVRVLGAGSNVLVPDAGVPGLVLRVSTTGITSVPHESSVEVVAESGVHWDALIDAVTEEGWWGIENLAGIPGTVGGAVVQNIGAYGTELSSIFSYADVLSLRTGESARITRADAQFAYRTSIFKQNPDLLIVRVGFTMSRAGVPQLSYADLTRAAASGVPLTTPALIRDAVREIRSRKFPPHGSAGSFFKNPVITRAHADELAARFPLLPQYPQEDGSVKVSLAWILDHVLHLKGYAQGPVRLYEQQPLVLVATQGARASDVDALAEVIRTRVYEATRITIEREVETIR